MKKLKNILIGLVAIISLTSGAYAGSFGIGVTGSYKTIDASGTETTEGTDTSDTSTRTASVDNNAFTGSAYIEYSLDDASWAAAGNGITIGAEYTPGSADVSDKIFSRTDTAVGAGTAGSTSGAVTYTAQAEVEKYRNYYIELPLYSAIYVKAGYSQIDVNTLEASTKTTTGSYGNDTLNGTNLGVGLKGVTANNIVWKLLYQQTNFDELSLTSSTSNVIKADLDTKDIALSIGYRF